MCSRIGIFATACRINVILVAMFTTSCDAVLYDFSTRVVELRCMDKLGIGRRITDSERAFQSSTVNIDVVAKLGKIHLGLYNRWNFSQKALARL